jgi:uncharacterized membrane protein YjfL (UPF0719 family)
MINLNLVAASLVYSLIGIVILVISFFIVEKITPENLYKELVENKNTAVAIVAGAFIIAIAIIIASAIH